VVAQDKAPAGLLRAEAQEPRTEGPAKWLETVAWQVLAATMACKGLT
jgi:hypothetical protein